MQHQIARSLIIISLIFISIIKSYAQEDAYWQGLSIKNPAVIGTPSDWVFGGYAFTNLNKLLHGDEKGPTVLAIGIDYNIAPQTGSLGFVYTLEEFGLESINQLEMSYAHSFDINSETLHIGGSVGIRKYKNELTRYSLNPDNVDPLYNISNETVAFFKAGIGFFYNSTKFDIGISSTRYFKLAESEENEYNNYSIDYTTNSVTLLGAYRFHPIEKFVIEPNLMVDLYDRKVDALPGIFFKYNNIVWAGYSNINLSNLHSIILGVDILKRFRAGYSYSFTKIFSNKNLNLHEFLLAIKLN